MRRSMTTALNPIFKQGDRVSKKPRRTSAAVAALDVLTPERAQHDSISRLKQIIDSRGEISSPYRVQSLLDRLVVRGDAGLREHAAGVEFARLYRLSALHPLRASDLMQEVRHQAADMPHGGDRARKRRDDAMDALGGHSSPCGLCAWFVLGEELSLREWALREGWGGRPLREETAKGILLGTLGVLAEHFGM